MPTPLGPYWPTPPISKLAKRCSPLPGPPWQRAYGERLMGSIRRECLDHGMVFIQPGCAASWWNIFLIITVPALIFPCTKTRRSHGKCSRRSWAEYIQYGNPAASTLVTDDAPPNREPLGPRLRRHSCRCQRIDPPQPPKPAEIAVRGCQLRAVLHRHRRHDGIAH